MNGLMDGWMNETKIVERELHNLLPEHINF